MLQQNIFFTKFTNNRIEIYGNLHQLFEICGSVLQNAELSRIYQI